MHCTKRILDRKIYTYLNQANTVGLFQEKLLSKKYFTNREIQIPRGKQLLLLLTYDDKSRVYLEHDYQGDGATTDSIH